MLRRWALGCCSLVITLASSACTVSWHPPRDAELADPDGSVAADDGGEDDAGQPAEEAGTEGPEAGEERPDAADRACDGASCDAPPEPLPVGRVGYEGALCTPEGAVTCLPETSARRLRCSRGGLRFTDSCATGALCDHGDSAAATGQCREIGMCDEIDKESIGCVGELRVRCTPDGRAESLFPCGALSHCERAGECVCDTGSTLGHEGASCEPFQLQGAFARAGAHLCGSQSGAVLGDAQGFWVALLFHTFAPVQNTAVLASQRVGRAGWALTETSDSVRFELGGGAEPGVLFAPSEFTRPQEPAATQLAVGVFDGARARLYAADVATGPAVAGSFTPATGALCALGEPGGKSSVSSVVIALAGGNFALSEEEIHSLFRETKRVGSLEGIRDKTQFSYGFAGDLPDLAPTLVPNRAGAGPELNASGFLLSATEFVQWGW